MRTGTNTYNRHSHISVHKIPELTDAIFKPQTAPSDINPLWTLIWEWRLYVFVPVLMLLMNFFKNDLLVILGLLAVTIALWVTGKMDDMSDSYLILFISGFLSAILSRKEVSESLVIARQSKNKAIPEKKRTN